MQINTDESIKITFKCRPFRQDKQWLQKEDSIALKSVTLPLLLVLHHAVCLKENLQTGIPWGLDSGFTQGLL